MSSKKLNSNLEPAMSRLRIIRGMALLLAVLGAYLFWISATGGAAVGCGPDSGCDNVLKSRWSRWFGIPVSAFAVASYLAVLVMSFRVAGSSALPARRLAWGVLQALAVAIAGAALWFAGIQLVVIKALCAYCMIAHAMGLVLAVLILRAAPSAKERGKGSKSAKESAMTPGVARAGVFAGVAAVVVLAGGQMLQPSKGFTVTTTATVDAAATGSAAATNPARRLRVLEGDVDIDIAEVPLIGRADAPHLMLSLYDYTCHHCRDLHKPLIEAYRSFSDQLAIVSLPMPLDAGCNHIMRQTPPAHANACEYARLGLAVWLADREKLVAYDDYIFHPPKPPPLDEARAFAQNLVGEAELAKAAADPRIAENLQRSIGIYTLSYRKLGKGSMPQLYIGNDVTFGPMGLPQLLSLLGQNFGLRRP